VAGSFNPLAGFGPAEKAKFLVLGSSRTGGSALTSRLSSLKNLEHVSPTRLKGLGISRCPVSTEADEASKLALMRRWFFARKPDAGFILTDFPATLLQARVFDEWLECRSEGLTAVFAFEPIVGPVVDHYRMLGLLCSSDTDAPA